MKKIKNVLLNFKGERTGKLELDEKASYNLRVSNLKINSDLVEFLISQNVLNAAEAQNLTYCVRGGSTVSGCPMHHSITTKLAKKIYNTKRKRKTKVASSYVTEKTRVLDVLVYKTNTV